jgi:hypothetical protein
LRNGGFQFGGCGRERGQPERERAMQVHAAQAQRATSTRKRKKRKRRGIKRGEGRREPERRRRKEKDGGRLKVRGGEEKASRKGDGGEEERPANGDCDSNTEKGERGRGGAGEERKGPVHCPKRWKGCGHQPAVTKRESDWEGVLILYHRHGTVQHVLAASLLLSLPHLTLTLMAGVICVLRTLHRVRVQLQYLHGVVRHLQQ